MKFLLDPKAKAGQVKFTLLQFNLAWTEANKEAGVVRAGEIKVGVTHPDFGVAFEKLNEVTQEFITRLCIMRSFHFAELAERGELRKWIDYGRHPLPRDPVFEDQTANRLHDDWVKLRAVMYTSFNDATKQALIDGGVKPFGSHPGDMSWAEEDAAMHQNDLRLVPKLGWLLGYIRDSEDEELQAWFSSLLPDFAK